MVENSHEAGIEKMTDGGTEEKEPVLSGLISFIIPGSGQLYNGQIARALAAFVGVVVADIIIFLLASLLVYFVIGIFIYFLIPVVHLAVAYDAYSQAKKINAGKVEV